MVNFSSIRKRIKGEKNDCTVMALAIATGQKYKTIHKFLARKGRKFGDGFNLNHKVTGGILLKGFYNKKVKTFLNQANNSNTYLIITKNHCLVYKKGKIYDNQNSNNLLIDQIIYEIPNI